MSRESTIVTISMPFPEPTAPPAYVTFDAPTSTSLLVSWRGVPLAHRNEAILGYRVIYHKVDNGSVVNMLNVSTDTMYVIIDKLEKSSNYCISVLGYNAVGDGPASKDIIPAGKEGDHTYKYKYM